MFHIGRSLVLVGVLSVLVSVGALYGARHLHNEFEGLLEARLQSDLISNNAEYRRTLLGVEDASIVLVGDIMLSRGVEMMIDRYGDYRYPFLLTADNLNYADIAFGNLEGPISERGTNQGSEYSFRARPEVLEGLQFAGFDILSIANNHILDWGGDAVSDTISILRSGGIKTVGAGGNYEEANAPIILRAGSARVGHLAFTTLYPEGLEAGEASAGVSDLDNAEEAVRALSADTDIVIVSLHWGEEYQSLSNDFQKGLARSLIDAGADLVVGHHPHVVQEVERYSEGWIVYSLGNFTFDQGFSDATRIGLAIEATVSGRKIIEIKEIQVRISKTFQPEFVNLYR